ncbi:MAG: tetratricopeptide repeat protein [Cryobacterium sp.]|nr:tetratricopeptide repeat protein [Oligoflexia bacterium]
MMKCEAMRLPFFFSLASLFSGVMVGVVATSFAGDYEDARKLFDSQKWSEALPLLLQLKEEEPDSVLISEDLAQVLLRLNRREEALELLKKHHLNRPAEIAGKTFLSKEGFRFYQQGLDWLGKRSYSQACERFERALEKDQGHFQVLLRLAQCETLDGNAELSLKLLDTLERIYGKSTESDLWRARAYGLRGRAEEAVVLFSSLASSKPPEPYAEWNTLWWAEALVGTGSKSFTGPLLENDAKKNPSHLMVALASLRFRIASAESTNQYQALLGELDKYLVNIARRKKEKKKPSVEEALNIFDADALERGAAELRLLVKAQLPSPLPSLSPAPRRH